jgi:ligand-binding sensor domain-containing protein
VRLLPAALLVVVSPALAQPATSRFWRPEERTLVTDLSRVTAVAASQMVVYGATRDALAVYDRGSTALRETLGIIDGYPGFVTTMVADPTDDTAWIGGMAGWAVYQPLGRRFDGGPLPGPADVVVLDQTDPSRGAYYHTPAGWYLVRRGALAAEPASDVPPPGRRIGSLSPAELRARAPAFDVIRLRIERDDLLRTWRITSAVMTPAREELLVGTDGNGLFRVDVPTYGVERFPAGLLSAPTASVAVLGDQVCAGSDQRYNAPRRGVSCFRSGLEECTYLEGAAPGALALTLGARRLLVTRRAVWAAGPQGALRIDRGGDVRQFGERQGLPSEDVRALAPAREGVWIGTARGYALAPDTGANARVVAAQVLDAAVLSLAARSDTVWIGTAVGLYLLLPGADAPIPAAPGQSALSAPIVALALDGDTILAATDTRLVWRAADAWHVEAAGSPIGRVTALAPDPAGFWVAGTAGLAFFQPARSLWRSLTAPGDVPQPVSDVAAGRDYVWAATPAGVVRLERRVLLP